MNTMVISVHRKEKAGTGLLLGAMIVLAVIFLLCGVIFNRGMMLPCFLMAGLYYFFKDRSQRDYEYTYDGRTLKIDLIRGKSRRATVHELDLAELEVVAPHDHEAVKAYRKGESHGRIPKFDYTSYEDGVPYYTMIIKENDEKIKLLLDLRKDCLDDLMRRYPTKVYR